MNPELVRVFFLRWIGNFLVLSALTGVFLTFAPVIQAEIIYRYDNARDIQYVVAEEKASPNLFTLPPNVQEISPLSTDFSIVIPKIAANAIVVPDVDPGDYNAYIKALQSGVAHAKGTVYPGQVGNTYLFAHSAGNFWEVNRWNAVFYLLKELEPGDEINLFYQGKRHVYYVYDKKVVDPGDTQYLSTIANYSMVTLQTCWPPGTTLKRLLVFGRLVSL